MADHDSNRYDPNSVNAVLARLELGQAELLKKLGDQTNHFNNWAAQHEEESITRSTTALATIDKQGDRITKLENWRWYMLGIGTAVWFALDRFVEWLTGSKGK